MTFTYGSVCSGIEAASIAWEPLGFKPAWFAEIEAFPAAVLAHHWPEVNNLGDMTKIASQVRAGLIEAPSMLVGGTPCQAFSVAGARLGLADERGQLTISYGELADAIDATRIAAGKPPAIIVWENVPGVLSSKDNAFGAFLGLLAGEECELVPPGDKWKNAGYVHGPQRTVAWRILDAQYFGVAQRRRRVFVVASARKDIDPAKILFERDSVRRDFAPSRSEGKAVAALTANGIGVRGADDNQGQAGHLIPQCVTGDITHTLKAEGFDGSEDGTGRGTPIIAAFGGGRRGGPIDVAACLTAKGQRIDFEVETFLAQFSSTGQGFWSEGCGTLRARAQESHEHLAVMSVHGTQDPDTLKNLAHTRGRNQGQENAILARYESIKTPEERALFAFNHWDELEQACIAFSSKDNGQDATSELSPTLRAGGHSTSHANAGAPPAVALTVSLRGRDGGATAELGDEVATCLRASTGGGDKPHVLHQMAVRRLTPVECERLQGFPDNHTFIPTLKRKKITADEYTYVRHHFPEITAEEAYKRAVDGPRYKAIGNSMAVPVMRWIGQRILSQFASNTLTEDAL